MGLRSICEVHNSEAQAHKNTITIIGLENVSAPATLYCHITKGLFTTAPFNQYMMPNHHEKKVQGILKKAKKDN